MLILVFIFFILSTVFSRKVKQTEPDDVWQFVRNHAAEKRAALTVRLDGKTVVNVNGDVSLPLASTMKIIVAIEYARQAAEGRIDPKKRVPLQALERYFIPRTDGGAHAAWLGSVERLGDGESVPLREVARGMIAYSSNANTDFLLALLGLEEVNRVLALFGLKRHEPIYPLAGSLFVPVQLVHEHGGNRKQAIQALKEMSLSDYRQRAIALHERFASSPPTKAEKKALYRLMSVPNQRIWSDRLARSTTEEYVSIMARLNSRSLLSESVHSFLSPVLEQLMESPENREWLARAGKKGGSTAFVRTEALYATTKDGRQLELALFADGLTMLDGARLSNGLNEFQLRLIRDEASRDKMVEVFR